MKRGALLLGILVAMLVLAAIVVLNYRWPLLRSSRYSVTALRDGKPIDVRLYGPLGEPGLYYLKLPDDAQRDYRWLGVNFSDQSAFVPSGVDIAPFGVDYMDWDHGQCVLLRDRKLEDTWTEDFRKDGSVHLANASLSLSLMPAP